MKTKLLFFLATFTTLFWMSCSPKYYETAAYEEYAGQHQTIAVVPSQTITTGRIPPEWTPETLAQIEENESKRQQFW